MNDMRIDHRLMRLAPPGLTFTVAEGHRLSIKFPASPDATLANGSITICATR